MPASPLALREMSDRLRPVLTRLGVLVASLVVTLAAVEYGATPLIYRRAGLPDRAAALLGFLAVPGARVDDTPINAQGFTGQVLEGRHPPGGGTVRVLTLGGSALFNRRMTERLAAALAKVVPRRLELAGGALRRHDSRSSLIKYATFFRRYGFDYVLIYEGINDLWANHVAPGDYREDYSHLSPWNRRNALLERSLLARYAYNTLLWAPPPAVPGGSNFRSVATAERNIRELVRLVREDGGVPVLLTFAWHIPEGYSEAAFWGGALDYVNPERYNPCPAEIWGAPEDVRAGLTLFNEAVRRVAREERVLLLDMAADFAGTPWLFGDVCHLNEPGTDRFVSLVADFFRQRVLPRAQS